MQWRWATSVSGLAPTPSLVFFTIALIGVVGFLSDWVMRLVQKKILYWVPETTGVLRGL